jgi:PhzF family phenazine biosynthesis protein
VTGHRYLIVDVFTSTPLEGNQLGVFLDGSDLDTDLMQRTTRELNLSETVFFLPPEAGGDARVRIFTPASELPLPAIRFSAPHSSSPSSSASPLSSWRPASARLR